MSRSENDRQEPLPAPISLTLEEAMRVAGGFSLLQSATLLINRHVLINGLGPDYWVPAALNAAVGQV